MKKDTFYLIANFEELNVRLEFTSEVNATELVEHFLQFCTGAGYHRESIIDAMANVVASETEL
jgi:hypothetical protein